MADASSTSVHMSEDSEVDEEDDEYSELDGVELYKGSSAAASTDNEEEMEAGSAPKLSASSASSSTSCPAEPKEVSRDMAALLDFAEYQDDVIQYLRSVDTKHTPKYQVRYEVSVASLKVPSIKDVRTIFGLLISLPPLSAF